MISSNAFIWIGTRGIGKLLTEEGDPDQLWAGDQVWQGPRHDQAKCSSTHWSLHARAQWERHMHKFLDQGECDPIVVIGPPEHRAHWEDL